MHSWSKVVGVVTVPFLSILINAPFQPRNSKMKCVCFALAVLSVLQTIGQVTAFSIPCHGGINGNKSSGHTVARKKLAFHLSMTSEEKSVDDGVVELVDEDDEEEKTVNGGTAPAPFLSQGEIVEEALNPDLSDPKQARVIIYIILSLVPVLFLIPLMLGSRDFIPLDALPPVEMGN